MAETAQANRVRHFELCFVEFDHSAEKLELGKSVSIFFFRIRYRTTTKKVPTFVQLELFDAMGKMDSFWIKMKITTSTNRCKARKHEKTYFSWF